MSGTILWPGGGRAHQATQCGNSFPSGAGLLVAHLAIRRTVMSANTDPVLAALPAEVRERVERTLASYGTEAGPAESSNLFPEIPEPGEVVTAPPLPKQPPRKAVGKHYCSGSQPAGWVERSVKMSREYRPRTQLRPSRPSAPRPEWNSSPSGRWKAPLAARAGS